MSCSLISVFVTRLRHLIKMYPEGKERGAMTQRYSNFYVSEHI